MFRFYRELTVGRQKLKRKNYRVLTRDFLTKSGLYTKVFFKEMLPNFIVSLSNSVKSNLYKADTYIKRTQICGSHGVRFREIPLYMYNLLRSSISFHNIVLRLGI